MNDAFRPQATKIDIAVHYLVRFLGPVDIVLAIDLLLLMISDGFSLQARRGRWSLWAVLAGLNLELQSTDGGDT